MNLLYHIAINIYAALIGLASLWNRKAAQWIQGRKDWRVRYKKLMDNRKDGQTVWVHCASLGEFEQGRPVIEAIRREFPGVFLVLSFFSPSGYEIRKNYQGADAVVYLPLDTPFNAKDFLDIVRPNLTLFIKYEYWVNYLEEMARRKIPLLMVSAIYREKQVFFRWYGGRWKKAIAPTRQFFVQDTDSQVLLNSIGVENVTVSGDTRFDRVLAVRENFSPVDLLEEFCRGRRVLVAGSTWDKDEGLLKQFSMLHPDVGLVLAPHEINSRHLEQLKTVFPQGAFYSSGAVKGANVLIIDNVGMLSRLYYYADICYVGGGFGAGIHNILEAAVYGKPVVFGPRYNKFREARDLVEAGGAFPVSGQQQLNETMERLLVDELFRANAGEVCDTYVHQQAGATGKLMGYIQENRLLTS